MFDDDGGDGDDFDYGDDGDNEDTLCASDRH
jgi:hypothetical protein